MDLTYALFQGLLTENSCQALPRIYRYPNKSRSSRDRRPVAPGPREKGPVRPYAAPIFIRLADGICRDRDQPAVANLHFSMKLQQAKHEDHRILSLQLG